MTSPNSPTPPTSPLPDSTATPPAPSVAAPEGASPLLLPAAPLEALVTTASSATGELVGQIVGEVVRAAAAPTSGSADLEPIGAAPIAAAPAPSPDPRPTAAPSGLRILALTEAGVPLTRAYARLVQALRDAKAEVIPLAVPREPPAPESVPTIAELKRGITSFAKDLVRGFRASETPAESWIASQLRAVEGRIDAVVTTDPVVARLVLPEVEKVWPGIVRVGVDGDYELDPEWKALELDGLIVAHPGLGGDLPRVREGRTRLGVGGPVVAGPEVQARKLDPNLPQVVVSFARLEPGDVDPLLFQLSLAHPERFSLLFLPTARPGVDELVRVRAAGYGLQGKRPKADSETEPWIRGAAVLVGHPSPLEAATAAAAGVPLLLFATERRLSEGDRFLVRHGAAVQAEVPITVSVHVEGLLPGGPERAAADKGLTELEGSGSAGAARAVLDAVTAGRPTPRAAEPTAAQPSAGDPDLEDIGAVPTASGAIPPADMPLTVRRAYLKEIILQQAAVEKQLARARAGLDTWQRRVRLARAANDDALADKAVPRVEGLVRHVDRLDRELRELLGLRERFARNAPLSPEDRTAVARFMSPATASSLDAGEAPDSAFTRLELEDALAVLKRKLDGK